MDRLQSLLDSLVLQHQTLSRTKGTDWKEESYTLGRIKGVRDAIMLLKSDNSTIPSTLID